MQGGQIFCLPVESVFHLLTLRVIPNDLDGSREVLVRIIKASGGGGKISASRSQLRYMRLAAENLSPPAQIGILGPVILFFFENIIYENGSPLSIKGQGVFIVSLSQNILALYPGHCLHGTVPGDDRAFPVDYQGGVGQKVDDIQYPAFGFPYSFFGPFPFSDIDEGSINKINLTLIVTNYLAGLLDPQYVAVLMPDTIFPYVGLIPL